MRLIDADAAIEALVDKGQASTRYRLGEVWELNGQEIREVLNALPSVQPEEAVPVSWIEGQIERLNNMDNYFAKLTADIIKTMLNEWSKRRNND